MAKKKKTKSQKLWQKTPLLAVVIGLIVFLVFLPGAFFGFINMDDLPLIVNNTLVKNASILDFPDIFSRQLFTPHYKPLVYMTWIAERSLFGINAEVLHFNNAILHAVNSALVFLLSLQILPRMWPRLKIYVPAAVLCALAWGLHPLRIESVTWAVERKDVLFGLFYLLAALNYIKYLTTNRSTKYFLFALLFFLLSCLSKSMGITFLATAILIEVLFEGKKAFAGKALLSKIPLVLIAILMMHLYGFLFSPEVSGGALVVNAAKQNVYVPDALQTNSAFLQFTSIANLRLVALAAHTLIPVKLAIVYPREFFIQELGTMIYALFAIPIIFLVLLYFKKQLRPSLGFGLFWFALAIAPILAADGSGTNFLSDRYTYMPSLGIIWFVIPGILIFLNKPLLKSRTTGELISTVIIILLTYGTITGIQHWKTSTSLWTKVIDTYPQNWYAYYNRAKLVSTDDPDRALSDLDNSIKYLSNQSMTYYARGTIYMQKGNYNQAISDFVNAINLTPNDIQSHINLASCYKSLKQYKSALDQYTVALNINKMRARVFNGRGATYSDMGNLQAALSDFNSAIEVSPKYDKAHLNRANLLSRKELKRYDEAISDFTFYLNANPQDHRATFNRGFARSQTNDHQGAITDFTTAIALHDTQGFYYFGRAQSYEQLGQNQNALKDIRRAQELNIQIDPAWIARLQQ